MDSDHSSSLSVRTTKDGSPTLFSERYQQTYHSIHGSLTESNYIFLDATGVRDRLQRREETNILEVGMGTGLNFLLTSQEAIESQTPLTYWTIEHTIIQQNTFQELHFENFIADQNLLNAYSAALDTLFSAPPNNTYSFTFKEHIHLHVLKGDATEIVIPDHQFHAVYQDAFSPDVNPELWSALFFQRIYNTMQPNGRLATFSVRRLVRDALSEAGFLIQKRPGPPGGKREMLLAIKPNHAKPVQQ